MRMTANLKTTNLGIWSVDFTYYVFVSGVVRNFTTKTMRKFYFIFLIEIYAVIFQLVFFIMEQKCIWSNYFNEDHS